MTCRYSSWSPKPCPARRDPPSIPKMDSPSALVRASCRSIADTLPLSLARMARSCFAWNCRPPSRRPRRQKNLPCRCCGNLNRSLELTASGENISSPGTPNKSQDARIPQNLLKRSDIFVGGSFKINSRPRIQGNQIYPRPRSAQQLHHFQRILAQIVDVVQQNIFKRHPLPVAQRKRPRGGHQQVEIIFFIQRHQLRALFVIRGIERNRQPRPNLLLPEIVNARNDAGG